VTKDKRNAFKFGVRMPEKALEEEGNIKKWKPERQ